MKSQLSTFGFMKDLHILSKAFLERMIQSILMIPISLSTLEIIDFIW